MQIKKDLNLKSAELKFDVVVEPQKWEDAQQKSKKELIQNVSIPGFRKGKVPADKAEKLVSSYQVMEKAINKLIPTVLQEVVKEISNEDKVIGEPSVSVIKFEKTELELTVTYPVYPTFELKGYKDGKVKFVEETFTDEDIENQKRRMLESRSVSVPTKDAIQKGDKVTFDFTGYIDGEKFEGGEAEDFELTIGSGQFIKGFEESLIGHKSGWEGDIKVKFPKDYYMKQYAGKEAKFEIKIKEVKRFDYPVLDEEFIKSLGLKDIETEAQLNDYLKDLTKREKYEQSRTKFQNKIFKHIIESTEFPIHESLILAEVKNLNAKFDKSLKDQEITREEYKNLTKFDEEEIGRQLKEEALKNLKNSLIFVEINKKENLELTEEDYDKEYASLAKLYHVEIDMIKQVMPKQNLELNLVNRKVIDYLIEANK